MTQSDSVFQEILPSKIGKGDHKKLAILQAVIECIATIGIEATTFESIAKVLSIRHSNVAYYFPDKKQLIASAIRWLSLQTREALVRDLEAEQNPEQLMRTYVRSYLHWAAQHPDQVSTFMLFFYYCTLNSEYRVLYTQIRTKELQRIQQILCRMPQLRPLSDLESMELAQVIQNLITGTNIDFKNRHREDELSLVLHRCSLAIDTLLQPYFIREAYGTSITARITPTS